MKLAIKVPLGIAVLLLTVALAACETMQMGLEKEEIAAMTPEQEIFLYSTQHKYARALAVAYESKPRCTELSILACSDPDIVASLRYADLGAETAINIARVDPTNANLALALVAYQTLSKILQEEILRALLLP